MTTENDEILYSSRFPFSIPFGVVIDILSILFFLYHIIFETIPILNGIIYIGLIMILVDLVICRYAGKIVFLRDRIIIKYFFPWRKDYSFDIEKIKALKVESSIQKFLSNYSYLIFTLENDKVERVNIVSWYSSMDGVKIVEEKFKSTYIKK